MKFPIIFFKKMIIRLYKKVIQWLILPLLLDENKKRISSSANERLIEYGFAFYWLQKLRPAEVLDVGSGLSAWPSIMANCGFVVTAIDKIEGYWKSDFFNRHFFVINDDITNPRLRKTFDFITCISVLEHIEDYDSAIANMFRLLNKNGYLLVTVPYNENKFMDNVYKHPNAGYGQQFPFMCRVYSRNEISHWTNSNSAKLIAQEYYQVFTGQFWTMGEEIAPFLKTHANDIHQLTCVLFQKL